MSPWSRAIFKARAIGADKGRHADGRDVIVTKNEILASLNAPEAFVLAIVQVDAADKGACFTVTFRG